MAAVALQFWSSSPDPLMWALLGLQLLVYPHAVYALTRRSPQPLQFEMKALVADAGLLGIWAAVLGFPLWISFAFLTGSVLNNAFNKGWRGGLHAALAFVLGAGAWALVGDWSWRPETPVHVALFCMAGLLVYLVLLGNVAHRRNGQLRQIRQELQHIQRAERRTHTTLKRQLVQVNALQEQLRDQAYRDPLTGLYNRRYLDTTLDRELGRCLREQHPMAIIMLDVDHFKKVNDTRGHPEGDEVLKALAGLLTQMARHHDVCCRFGGEEFVLLLPQMPLPQAVDRAQAVRQAFEDMVFGSQYDHYQVTLSAGVACFPNHGQVAADLLHLADQALYAAKRDGRNRVVRAQAA